MAIFSTLLVIIQHPPSSAAGRVGASHCFILGFKYLFLGNYRIPIWVLGAGRNSNIIQFFNSVIQSVYIKIQSPYMPLLMVVRLHIGMHKNTVWRAVVIFIIGKGTIVFSIYTVDVDNTLQLIIYLDGPVLFKDLLKSVIVVPRRYIIFN